MKNIPRNEIQMVHQIGKNKEEFIITTNFERNRYTLYLLEKEGYQKISSSRTPIPFDEIISNRK